ncbi:hypothetical protein HWV62_45390 [Athelia sp. TMB]|nr:hypothetical protein HWV62_45390 [Athelia sp. TMB]
MPNVTLSDHALSNAHAQGNGSSRRGGDFRSVSALARVSPPVTLTPRLIADALRANILALDVVAPAVPKFSFGIFLANAVHIEESGDDDSSATPTNTTLPAVRSSSPLSLMRPPKGCISSQLSALPGPRATNQTQGTPAHLRAGSSSSDTGPAQALAGVALAHTRAAGAPTLRARTRMESGLAPVPLRAQGLSSPAVPELASAGRIRAGLALAGNTVLPAEPRKGGRKSKAAIKKEKAKGHRVLCMGSSRVYAAICGLLEDKGWDGVCRGAAEKIKAARDALSSQEPENASHSPHNIAILASLCQSEEFVRISRFTASCLATWALKLFQYYNENITTILTRYPRLQPGFLDSPFACSTINFGPQTVSFDHTLENERAASRWEKGTGMYSTLEEPMSASK